MPPLKSERKRYDGGKCHKTSKVAAKSATIQIRVKKVGWQKVPSKQKSGGRKFHQNSKVMAKSATTFQSWWNNVVVWDSGYSDSKLVWWFHRIWVET